MYRKKDGSGLCFVGSCNSCYNASEELKRDGVIFQKFLEKVACLRLTTRDSPNPDNDGPGDGFDSDDDFGIEDKQYHARINMFTLRA